MADQQKGQQMNQVLEKINTLAKDGKQKEGFSEFIDKLIEEKGFPTLTSDIRDVIKNDLIDRLDNFIAARVIASLSDEDLKTFETMLTEKKLDAEMQQFVSTHIPDFVNFLTATLLEFRAIYLGLINVPITDTRHIKQDDVLPAPPAPAPANAKVIN